MDIIYLLPLLAMGLEHPYAVITATVVWWVLRFFAFVGVVTVRNARPRYSTLGFVGLDAVMVTLYFHQGVTNAYMVGLSAAIFVAVLTAANLRR